MAINPREPRYEARRLRELASAVLLRLRSARRDRWSRDQVERLQQTGLRELVRQAIEHSPVYGELYADVPEPTQASLASLPVVGKAQLMDRFADWVTAPGLRLDELQRHLEAFAGPDGYYRGRYRVLTTGGSSGRKGVFVFDSREWAAYLAQLLRFMDIIGVRPRIGRRLREATVAAGHPLHATYRGAASVDIGIARTLRLDASTPLPQLVKAVDGFAPDWLHAYPSVAAMLAQEQLDGHLHIAPRVVSTSSELRTPEMAELIHDAWQQKPFDMYGITEAGIFGMECEQHRLHAMDDTFIFEVVDDDNRPVPTGEAGAKLLITNLTLRTQPLIRYEVDDMVTVSPDPCPCGRPFPVLQSVEGRSDDILRLPDRKGGNVSVHPMRFRSPLAAERDVRQYQVIHRREGITLRIVPARQAAREALERHLNETISRELSSAGADPPPVNVEFVEKIERETERMSKLKLVRSEIETEPQAAR